MTRSIFEPSTSSDISSIAYRVRQLERRPPTLTEAVYEIKLFADTDPVVAGDRRFIFAIPNTVGGMELLDADGFVTTVSSSGTPTFQVRNITNGDVNMLSVPITIDQGDYTSYAATALPEIWTDNAGVSTADLISIDVDDAGTGAQGAGVILRFGVRTVPIPTAPVVSTLRVTTASRGSGSAPVRGTRRRTSSWGG